jgi:PGF-pre-PGF domain-containing protein
VSADEGVAETVELDQRAGNVTLDTVAITANRSTAVRLNVTASGRPLPDAPAFDVSPDTEGLGYFRVDHTVSNEDLTNVTLTVSVDRSAVTAAGAEPEEIALYRYSDGRWVAQPTRLVDETQDTYLYAVPANGLSDWVAGTNRPEMRIAEASVTVEASVEENPDRARIEARITNNGDADGVYVARLLLEESIVDERRVTVPEAGTVQVTFERSFGAAGTYRLTVNNVTAGIVEVSEAGDVSVRDDEEVGVPAETTTAGRGPVLPAGGPALVFVLLVGLGSRWIARGE